MSTTQKSIAIITGASSGLGKEFALQLADEKYNINEFWLIARRKNELEKLSEQIKSISTQPHLNIKIIELDLTQVDVVEAKLVPLLKEHKIKWFVNNAGFGLVGFFDKLPLKKQLEMIQLNVTSMTQLTGLVLPNMEPQSHIIITASSAGFFPLPTFAVYGATKAYVVSFANALASELLSKQISVTALCPGPVKTEFFDIAFIHNKDIQNKNKMSAMGMAESKDVVKKALADAQKKKLRSTYGWLMNFFVSISGIIPRNVLKTKIAWLLHK